LAPNSRLHADDLTRDVAVSWDFGSAPDRDSNFYVGDRNVPVKYRTAECLSRFALEEVRYELSQVEVDGKLAPGSPPFVMFKLRKHFEGEFSLLPEVKITESKVNKKKKKATGETGQVVFPFRQREMAAPVDEWIAKDIVISLGAPGEIMDLHNPADWVDIRITCE
jgi:hypothetical protein